MGRGISRGAMSLPLWVQPRAQSRRATSRVLAVIFIMMGLAFLFVWSRSEVVQMGYRISEVRKQQEKLLSQKSQLELERASLRDPRRIEEIATRRLGMHLPKPSERIILRQEEHP